MKYKTANQFVYRTETINNDFDTTIPNQAPALEYIYGATLRGENLRIGLGLKYEKEATIDDVDMRFIDKKHLTVSQIDRFAAGFQEPPKNEQGKEE